jgi:hypothetical protein
MPTFSGHFELQNPPGAIENHGPCQIAFDEETFTLTPSSAAPLAIDLGDIDLFTPGEYDLTLKLHTGQRLLLKQFGKAFQNLAADLLEAYRKRLIQCLLLEDLDEVAQFEGTAALDSKTPPDRSFSSPAQIRIYRSNLAVLPTQATGFQWRLAEIDSIAFDDQNYRVVVTSGGDTLSLARLAKRTSEFRDQLQAGITAIREKSAELLHRLLPFLAPGEFQKVAEQLREGQPASLAMLNGIDARIERALMENVLDAQLQPYVEALRGLSAAGGCYTGFKFIREEEDSTQAESAPAAGGESEAIEEAAAATAGAEPATGDQEPVLHWFFFPLARRKDAPPTSLAWEAVSRRGRATYFFRLPPGEPIESAVAQINRALVRLNFRREPVYLPGDKLEMDARYRRYAIACRKLPELRRLRASFAGRAFHTSLEAWHKQVEEFLGRS